MAKGKPQPSVCAVDKQWEARNDCDTLMRAQEIERDKRRYPAALKELRRRAKEINAAIKDA